MKSDIFLLLIASLVTFFFGLPGIVFVEITEPHCDFLCFLLKGVLYSSIFFVIGVIFNYYFLKNTKGIKNFLIENFIENQNNNKKIKKLFVGFVFGGFFSYVAFFLFLLFESLLNAIKEIIKGIENISKN